MSLEDAIIYMDNIINGQTESSDAQHINQCTQLRDWLAELYILREKNEQGLLITLPCKSGDTIWERDEHLPSCISECTVESFEFDANDQVYCIYRPKSIPYISKLYLDSFGERLFTSKKEAENFLS